MIEAFHRKAFILQLCLQLLTGTNHLKYIHHFFDMGFKHSIFR